MSLSPAPVALLDPGLRIADVASLRRWGDRIGLNARDARHIVGRLATLVALRSIQPDDVLRFYRAKDPSHSFHAKPHEWLRMTEVQATKGLAHFLSLGGAARTQAFLRALDPAIHWPSALSKVQVDAEFPADDGRIDLMVTGVLGETRWGAVIEAKFAHSSKDNPLPAYARRGKATGMTVGMTNGEAPTGILLIVGQKRCRGTRLRLASNRQWRFLDWNTLLRRFEVELVGLLDDEDFRRFRRTLWERAQ